VKVTVWSGSGDGDLRSGCGTGQETLRQQKTPRNDVRSDKQTYNSETGFMAAEFSRLTRLIDNEIILQTHFE
jgi:hypothetical protein